MGVIASDIATLQSKRPPTQCDTCTFLQELDAEDREAVAKKIAERRDGGGRYVVSARDLADYLATHGGPSKRSIEHHRLARHG